MKKNIIIIGILSCIILAGCTVNNTLSPNSVSTGSENNSINTTENTGTNSIEEYYGTGGVLNTTGSISINGINIIHKQESLYTFFDEITLVIPSNPIYWDYNYSNYQNLNRLSLNNTDIPTNQKPIIIRRDISTNTNKCLSMKDNIQGKILSFNQNQKKIGNITIDTVISRFSSEMGNTKYESEFGIMCFSIGNYQYEISITDFSTQEIKDFFGSISFK